MDRRTFVGSLAAGLGALAAHAQRTNSVPRIGYLAPNLSSPRLHEAFRQALHDLGYLEGRSVVIEERSADGKEDRLPTLAAELAALKVDVIVTTGGTTAALAAKQATDNLPIVFIAVGDPVTSGLVTNLARPDGNVTGVSLLFPEVVGKCLEQITRAVPGITRVAVLWQPGAVPDRTYQDIFKGAEAAARALDVRLQFVGARAATDIVKAFAEVKGWRADALAVLSTPMFTNERRRLANLAATNKLPTVFSFKEYVEAGGLMSYGPDLADLFRRAATYVDKILKGAKPADLPVEQPTKFELVINLKTAKALGLTIPQSLLLRADEVIR